MQARMHINHTVHTRGDHMQANTNMQRTQAQTPNSSLLSWWIKLTSPDPEASSIQHNSQWREEVISLLIPTTILLALFGILTSLDNPIRAVILGIAICCMVGAL